MTYLNFLLVFLIVPTAILLTLAWRIRRGDGLAWSALFILPLVAVAYTTPWDNYLVANGVWWYARELVSGMRLGWVPIEEYLFFVLQPLLIGSWLRVIAKPTSIGPVYHPSARMRVVGLGLVGFAWVLGAGVLIGGWLPGRYLGLELAWGLPPLMLQLGFGADILWHERRRLFLGVIPPTIYLSAADALAIQSGTWTINPGLSLGIRIAGVLPVEECIFFLLTSTLIAFSVVLLESQQAADRLAGIIATFSRGSRPI